MQRVEFCINEIREIKNHFYGKRQTANVNLYRDEVFPLIVVYCILLQFLLKTKLFHASFIHKNCFRKFLSSYFLFWEVLNLNLTFAVCREHDS